MGPSPDATMAMPEGAAERGHRERMGLLARSRADELAAAFARAGIDRPFRWLRTPEVGLVMVRGRAGGSGAPFNLGEVTVTRCAVVLEDGAVGHGYVRGRAPEHARMAALVDAAAQVPSLAERVEREIISPLAAAEMARRAALAAETAATRVEFFTMERGDDP